MGVCDIYTQTPALAWLLICRSKDETRAKLWLKLKLLLSFFFFLDVLIETIETAAMLLNVILNLKPSFALF